MIDIHGTIRDAMNRHARTLCLLGLLVGAGVIAGLPRRALAGPWYHRAWRWRREVTLEKARRTGLDGEDVAVVTMPTAGKVRGDGSDLRVTTSDGRPVAHRVLTVGPGDRVRLAFATRPPVRHYHVYSGLREEVDADSIPQGPDTLAIRRGVLLESWAYRRGGANGLQQARGTIERSKELLGRSMRDRIFLGHNPFGPGNAVAARFTGWLNCPSAGEYTFALTSRNATFLLIDGKAVVANPGWHGPQRRPRHTGSLRLTEGIHEITVLHVNPTGPPQVVAAWRPPGGRRIVPIPPAAYAPFARAEPGPLDEYGKDVQADFLYDHGGEAFVTNRYYQRYAFRGLAGGSAGVARFEWDFGDGQRATGREVEHVYLTSGMHTVTCRIRTAGGVIERTNRLFVSRNWDRASERELEPVAAYGRIVSGYDFAKLSGAANAEAVLLLGGAELGEAMLSAGEALAGRESLRARQVGEAMIPYVEALVSADRSARAAGDLLSIAEASVHPDVSARAMVRAGRILLDELGRTTDALSVFRTCVKTYAARTTDAAIRDARIGIGDVWRAGGDADKARAAYREAGAELPRRMRTRALARGDFARHVEFYTRQGKVDDARDQLAAWARALPGDQLDGYWSWLKVGMEIKARRPADAVREADILLRVNPASNYAPRLLLAKAEACRMLSRPDAARQALRMLIEDYGESELVAEARERLSALSPDD
jgi:tetratricopeptide (TPR) repeat protein